MSYLDNIKGNLYTFIPDNEGSLDKANSLKYSELCKGFKACENSNNRKKKLNCLLSKQLKDYLNGQSAYPIMRLLLPQLDKGRSDFGLKVKKLVDIFIECLGIDKKHDPHAKRLIGWKDPKEAKEYASKFGPQNPNVVGTVGDFSSVLYEVLISRGNDNSNNNLTIGDLNKLLDDLAKNSGKNGRSKQKQVFTEILSKCNAEECKWFSRIVEKDMKMGVKQTAILNHFHPDAEDAFNVHNNLRKLCSELRDPNVRRKQEIEIFQPCAPMLAKGKLLIINFFELLYIIKKLLIFIINIILYILNS